jgi:hypothetical protein
LRQTLKERFKITNYVRDPSNKDQTFERVRWREKYSLFAEIELSVSNIIKAIERIQISEDFLEKQAQNEIKTWFINNYINLITFKELHQEMQIRVLRKILRTVSEQSQRIISYTLLSKTVKTITQDDFKTINLANCILRKDKTENIQVSKEKRKTIGKELEF